MADNKNFFQKNYKDIIKPVIVLLSICIIIPLALSLTNKVTSSKISELEKENQQKSMQNLIKADDFVLKNEKDFDYYEAMSSNKVKGYIFITKDKGYGGDVSVMTAVGTDSKIISVAILDVSNETPGLGQNSKDEKWYSQFANKTKGITVKKNEANEENNEIQAITGATITSKAVTRAVNTAMDEFDEINKGVSKDEK